MDSSQLAFPKGPPRVVDRIARKAALASQERLCRAAVKRRDHGRCQIPGCREMSRALHHIVFRSQGGKWRTPNVCSLCTRHHQLLHGGLITISGNADEHLTITGDAKYLRFKL